MLKQFLLVGCLVITASVFAQIDLPNNSVKFDSSESNMDSPTGFEIPAIRTPTLSNTKNPNTPINSDLGKEKEKQIDMQNGGDGLIEYTGTNKAPKYFTKDKEEKPEYGKDQYLGDFKTKAKTATVMYRDHEFVDGDMIRVYLNGEVIIPHARLEGSFRGFDFPLQDGFNKIDFEALNQGSSGPNTAQLNIFDEIGNLLASYEWNLLTGNKATAIMVKQ